ncbi:MAG: hypothetical protein ACREOO_02655 [bacterium]
MFKQRSQCASRLSLLALALMLMQACAKPVPFSMPDEERFLREVASPALRDSLQLGRLTVGMPYFVVADICRNQKGTRRVAVAGPGSAQPLKESEGFGRRYVDPTIKVFLDEYDTGRGKLRAWYRMPDFYRMHVASGDTLVTFWQEQRSEALIQSLYHENRLLLARVVDLLPAETKFYGEIRHVNAPDGRKTSHWYNLKLWQDRQSVVLIPISHELYPLVWMELDGETLESFPWR